MWQRDLGDAVGISLGSANYVLNALIEKGLVKLANFRSAKDKRRYAYILTPEGLSEKAAITQRFVERKIEEYEALKAEIDEIERELGGAPENSPLEKVVR